MNRFLKVQKLNYKKEISKPADTPVFFPHLRIIKLEQEWNIETVLVWHFYQKLYF